MEIKLPIFDAAFVETLIPQKKPFVMVDALISFSERELESAFIFEETAIFCENGYFQSAGILEHQAQSVALHTGYKCFLRNEIPPVGYIGAVKSFEVFELPKISEKLQTKIQILEELMGVTLVEISTTAAGKDIAKSVMKTVLNSSST